MEKKKLNIKSELRRILSSRADNSFYQVQDKLIRYDNYFDSAIFILANKKITITQLRNILLISHDMSRKIVEFFKQHHILRKIYDKDKHCNAYILIRKKELTRFLENAKRKRKQR